jgi:polyphosphate kinase
MLFPAESPLDLGVNQLNEKKSRCPYINRELSWMDFNIRVLEEAFKRENPIMERMRFLGITASNLDEFFMVRVAGVMEQVESKYQARDPSGLSPAELLPLLSQKIHVFAEKQYSCLNRSLFPALKRIGIRFLPIEKMDEKQKQYVSADAACGGSKPSFSPFGQQKPEYCRPAEKKGGILFCCCSGSFHPFPVPEGAVGNRDGFRPAGKRHCLQTGRSF